MVDTRRVKDESGRMYLCETFTNDETKVLRKMETGEVYGQSVVDLIMGYAFGKPFCRFQYEEIDKPVVEEE